MKKQVTFVESLNKDKGCENGQAVTRSAEVSNGTSNGYEVGFCQKARRIGTHITISASAGNKPFYFPKYMTTAPLLQKESGYSRLRQFRILEMSQHPSLTAGQRRYLHSITNIYSTEQMRRQMKQHYLDVLHSCLQSGQTPVTRRRCGNLQLQQTQKFRKESTEKETGARAKPQGRRQSSSIAHPNIRLPKIVNR